MGKKIRILTYDEALEKLRHFCAYQERSRLQVERKLKLLLVDATLHLKIVQVLEEEKFLDQERYASAYARGKSRIKGWGLQKINSHLRFELGSAFDAELVQDSADMEKAKEKLRKALQKKANQFQQKQDPNQKAKLIRFCLSRGFSLEESLPMVEKILITEKQDSE